jgi:N-glycosylase/DNA lyase
MKLLWEIEDRDVARVRAFYSEHENNEFVVSRRRINVEGNPPKFSRPAFWKAMVSCLLTTQQRAGPNSAVSRFSGTRTFSLNYGRCRQQPNLERFARKTLVEFGGIRRSNRLAEEIQYNFTWLEDGGWDEIRESIARLKRNRSQKAEARAADFIDDSLKGFGPKQSRNLLQGLGLTRHEIPIDSRITKWLNEFGFPIVLSTTALADRNYYGFVADGFHSLCKACDIYPCLLDAAIFSSYD